MDYERLASELVRAWRGKRSQPAFARRLGYRSNVIYRWEAGRAFPTAADALRAARRAGVEPRHALRAFYRTPPAWIDAIDPASPRGIATLLRDLAQGMPKQRIARAIGLSRFAVTRWLGGKTQPKLPDLLRMIEATSLRVVDFASAFAAPEQLPSIADAWRSLQASRAAAYELPWSHGVLRALELDAYAQLPRHVPGWLAQRIGVDEATERSCLRVLAEANQIRFTRGRFRVEQPGLIDLRAQPEAAQRLRAFWLRVALERLEAARPGTFSYNLCALSADDYERIRTLYRKFFSEVEAIVAGSKPIERVALMGFQWLDLEV